MVYSALKSEGYTDIGDEQDFIKKMQDEQNRLKVYNALKSAGYSDMGSDFKSFSGMIYTAPQPKPQPAAAPATSPQSSPTTIQTNVVQPVVKTPATQQPSRSAEPITNGQARPHSGAYTPNNDPILQQMKKDGKIKPAIPSFSDIAEQTAYKPMPMFDSEQTVDANGNIVSKPNPVPTFKNGRMGMGYHDMVTGEYYDINDPASESIVKNNTRTYESMKNLAAINRQQVGSMTKTIDDMLRNAEKKQLEEGSPAVKTLEDKDANWFQKLGAAMAMGNQGNVLDNAKAVTANQMANAPSVEVQQLTAAKRSMRDAQRMIAEADKAVNEGNFDGFFKGAGRGFGNKLFDVDTWDMGASDGSDALNLYAILQKADKGEKLTDAEQILLDAKAVELATNAYFGSYVGRGYNAGEVTAESIPFMLEMCVNPASGAGQSAQGMLTRYALKRFGNQAVKNNVKKYVAKVGARVSGDFAGAATMAATTGIGHVTAGTAERMSGDIITDIDETTGETVYGGHTEGEDALTAFGKAFASTTIENYSEMVGEYFAPVLAPAAKWAGGQLSKGMGNIGLGRVNDFIENVAASDVARLVGDFEKHSKWNGVFGEYAEEVAGNMMNALVVGDMTMDTAEGTGVFNLDQNIDTFLGVSLMGGFMSGVKTLGYRTPKYRARKDMMKADDNAASLFSNPEEWGAIRNTIAFGSDEDVAAKTAEVVSNDDLTDQQKAAALKYIKSVEEYKGILRAEDSRRSEDNGTVDVDAETSYDNGYTLDTYKDMNDAKNMYDYKRQQMQELVTEDFLEQFDNDPVGSVAGLLNNDAFTEDEKQLALDYVNAKATWDGMIDRVRDDIDSRVEASNRAVDSHVNKQSGMIHPATLNLNDRKVYVVDGKLLMQEDGIMVDIANSSESILVRDAETGKLEWASPHDFLSVDEEIDPAEEKEAAQAAIREQYAQQKADVIDGVLPFAAGDIYDILDEQGQQHQAHILQDNGDGTVQVSYDGTEAITAPKAAIQDMAEKANLARLQQFEQQRTVERRQKAAQEAQEQYEAQRPTYNLNDEVTLRGENGEPVRGSITAEENEDGQIEVYTESPINGKKVHMFTRRQIDDMLMEHNGEAVVVPEAPAITAEIDNAGAVQTEPSTVQNEVQNEVQGGDPAEEPLGTVAGEEETVAVEPMPMVKVRGKMKPDWGKATPERAHAYLYNERGLSRENANAFVENNRKAAASELEKQRKKKPEMGTDLDEFDENTAKWQSKMDEAQRALTYWNGVREIQNAIQREENERRAAEDAVRHDEAVAQAQADYEARKEAEAERKAVGNENPMPAITEKWNNAAKVDGHRDEIMLPDGTPLKGHYVLHESGASSPSHNPETWQKTDGFPMDANDNSVNDRDYERDRDAQEHTRRIARQYDQRALQSVPVVSNDGVVLSGNGRTMAGEIAARENTDGAYLNYLKEYAPKFGFTAEQVEAMQHPRVSFVPDEAMPYTAETFSRFNQQEMKSQNKTEQSVKLGKTVGDDSFRRIVRTINGYDTLGDFYNDAQASLGAVSDLHHAGVIPQAQLAEMVDGVRGKEKLSAVGREFLENMLIGKAFEGEPDVVRMLTAEPAMRQAVITALGEIVDNIALGKGYSLQGQLADAVRLCYDARNGGAKYGEIVSTYARQGVLFADPDELQTVADFNNATMLMLADALNDKRVTQLKIMFQLYNKDARESAAGQIDMFAGVIKSPEEILRGVIKFINENYGRRKEIEAAQAAAVERRKADSVQENGTPPASSGGSEKTGGSAYDRHGYSQLGSGRQGALETSVTDEERTSMQARIVDWLSDENLTAALGKSRTEIFDLFGNALEPIAYIPSQYLPLISKDIKDPRIYCGMAYFIDHALRNHGLDGTQATIEDVDVSKYLNIQTVLDNPDAIKETYVDGKRTVVFVKKIGRYFAELTQVEEDGKVILHKSLFSQKKEPYAKLNDIRSENSSSEGGTSSIGHAAEATPAISLQSRGDDMLDTSVGKDSENPSTNQAKGEKVAENQGAGGVQASLAAADAVGKRKGTAAPQKDNISTEEAEEPAANATGTVAAAITEAEAATEVNPTDAQKEAGNYKKGHVRIDGYDITIENPKGSVRRGTDADGKQWSITMNNTYGYIRGTEGVDGDHIDIYLSDDPSNGDVFVVDQVNQDGSFDEHKVMYGFASEEEARKAYLSNYEEGWQGLGAITHVSKEEFKKWVESSHRKTKPFADYKNVKAITEDVEQRRTDANDGGRLPVHWDFAMYRNNVAGNVAMVAGDGGRGYVVRYYENEGDAAAGLSIGEQTVSPDEFKRRLDSGELSPVQGTVRRQKGVGAGGVSSGETALRDALVDVLRGAGVEVVTDVEEGQRVIDEENGGARMQAKKRALETVSVTSNEEHQPTVVSSADGVNDFAPEQSVKQKANGTVKSKDSAKIQNILDNLVSYYEKRSNYAKGFITDIAKSLSMKRRGSSNYRTFELPNGNLLTVRLSKHNANVSNFYSQNELEGISIVVSPHINKKMKNKSGDKAHVVEFYYSKKEIENVKNGKPLAEILKSIKGALITGIFKDTTGLAERQEVNADEVRQQKVSGVRFFRTADGHAYGFTKDGKIYIDPRIATAETPVHEYSHLWASAMRELNPEEWANIVGLMKGTTLWDEVRQRYPELKTEDEIADEVLAQYSGRRGAERLRAEQEKIAKGEGDVFEKAEAISALNRVRDALKRFWKGVADWFGIHFTTAEEVADKVLSDLLHGVRPAAKQQGTVDEILARADEKNRDIRYQFVGENGAAAVVGKRSSYKAKDGSTVTWRSLFSEEEMRGISEEKDGAGLFDPTSVRLRKLEAGETCHVERRYVENGMFDFTGKDKVESADDVAYIFRQLENAAVENSFMVLVKDGKPTVIHLAMGAYTSTMAPFEHAFVAYSKLNPDEVYFVHNHPSGTLKASRQDQEVLSRIKQVFGEDIVQPGIIIDTTSGKYGEFDLAVVNYDLLHTSGEKEMPRSNGEEVPIKVYNFGKQVFARDWNPRNAFKITSSDDVASFVSSHRLGEHKKMSLLVLGNDNSVVANLFLPFTRIGNLDNVREVSNLMSGYIHQCGGVCGVLYGNYDYTSDENRLISRISSRMKELGTRLLDVIHVEHSANDEGLVYEPGASDESLDVVNRRFNDELDKLNEENAQNIIFEIGNPGYILRSAGLSDMPIRLYGNKLFKKMRKHGFDATDVKDLPKAINDPIAVFNNYGNEKNRAVLTELKTSQGNVLVTIEWGKGTDAEINIVTSVFGKGNSKIVDWINKGFATYINKSKALDYLRISAPIAEAQDNRELSDAAKIVENFENPKFSDENILREGQGTYSDDEISLENDSISKMLGKSRYTTRQREVATFEDGQVLPIEYDWVNDGYKVEGLNALYTNMNRLLDSFRVKYPEYIATMSNDQESIEVTSWRSVINDTRKPRRRNGQPTKAEQEESAYIERKTRRAIDAINAEAKRLGLKVEVRTDTEGLKGRRARAKGWYDTMTGKIAIIIPNHTNGGDVMRTLLHEGVAHYGLRKLFGEDFDNFLDNVYNNVDKATRKQIADLAAKNNWDFRVATEEYLAGLAEDTDFERAMSQSWWGKIRFLFLEMLRKAGINLDLYLRDADLRYILWRSYENLATAGEHGILKAARNEVMQERLGVGNYGAEDNTRSVSAEAVEENEIRYRDGDIMDERDRAIVRDRYDRMMQSGMYQFREAMQDSMLSLRRLMEYISEATGEEVRDFENAYMAENALSSKNHAEQNLYGKLLFNPMLDEIHRLAKEESSRDEVTRYMMAKHGLERNEVMARRAAEQTAMDELGKDLRAAERAVQNDPLDQDALDALDAVKQRMQDRVDELYNENRERDYGGITGLMEEDDIVTAEGLASQLVEDFENNHDTTELWARTNACTKATLEKTYKSGLLSKSGYDEISGMYEYYIPLRGFDATTSDEVYSYLNHERSGFSTPLKKAEGRKSVADDPIATIANMADSAIVQGNRNLMKQKFLKFSMNHPSDAVSVNRMWLRYDDVNGVWEAVTAQIDETDTPDEVFQKTEQFEETMKQLAEADPDHYKRGKDAANIPYKTLGKSLNEHQVHVKLGGEDYILTINGSPRAAQALNGLTNPDNENAGLVGAAEKLGGYVNRQMSAFYTTRNPEFVLSNFIRDALYANSTMWVRETPNYAIKFNKNFLKVNPTVLYGLIKKHNAGKLDMNVEIERAFYQFMMNGGETGYTVVKDIDKQKKLIKKYVRMKDATIPVEAAWKLLGDKLDDINRSVENCARFAAFLTSRQMGRTVERSVFDAKEVSVNFNKKGAGSTFFGKTGQTYFGNFGAVIGGLGRSFYVFWNASVQGLTNFASLHKHHTGKALLMDAGLFLLGAILAGLGGGDDDDYWNLPSYVRRSNICFKIPFTDSFVSIPLGIEHRAIYGLGELFSSLASGRERMSGKEIAKEIAGSLSSLMPLDVMEDGSSFMPSYVKPYTEAYISNKDWRGMPIYKDTPYNKEDPEWTKASKRTNQYIVDFARLCNKVTGGDEVKKGWLNFNPSKIEHLLEGVFGGVSTTANKLVKAGEMVAGKQEFDWSNILIASRVVKSADENAEARRINAEYWKYYGEYKETKRLVDHYEDQDADGIMGAAEKLDFMYNSPEYGRYEIVDDYYSEVKDLSDELNETTNDEERKELETEINALKRAMVEAIRAYDDARK